MPNPILLYDGVCGLCNQVVQFVLNVDRRDRFRFASLQSEFARIVLRRHGIEPDALDTFYLVENYEQPDERLTSRSDAAIGIGKQLGGIWKMTAQLFRLYPKALRDFGYNQVSRHRYRLFGKFEACPLPDARDRHKFLDN